MLMYKKIFMVIVLLQFTLFPAWAKKNPQLPPPGISDYNETTKQFYADAAYGKSLGLPQVPFTFLFANNWGYFLPEIGKPTQNYIKLIQKNTDKKITMEMAVGYLASPPKMDVAKYFDILAKQIGAQIVKSLPKAKLISIKPGNLSRGLAVFITVSYQVKKHQKGFEEDEPGEYFMQSILVARPPPFEHGLFITFGVHNKLADNDQPEQLYKSQNIFPILNSLQFILQSK